MNIFITGATGFIGTALINELLIDKTAIIHGFSFDTGKPIRPIDNKRVIYQEGDLRDFEVLQTAVNVARPELVFHLAAAGVREPFLPLEEALDHNLQGTINLLRAVFEGEAAELVRRVVVCRTPGERTAMNHYAASKAAAWLMCQMFARTKGWPIAGGVIFQVYGPNQSEINVIPAAIKAALEDGDFPMTEGTQERDWVYIDDVVRGLIALGESDIQPGLSVDIGSGRLISVADMVKKIYDLVGGAGRPLIGALPTRPGEEKVQVADVSRTKELIGWESSIILGNGLQETVNRYK